MNDDFLSFNEQSEYDAVLTPPTIQYLRGDRVNKDPLLANGAWELPLESWGMIEALQKNDVYEVNHSGTMVSAYLLPGISFAYLNSRFQWIRFDNDQAVYLDGYEEGAKGRLQIWCIVKELGNAQAVVSVSGLNSKHLKQSFFNVSNAVVRTASQMAKRGFPRHAFFLPAKTVGEVKTNNNQYVTPPEVQIPQLDQETIQDLFVGKEIFGLAESLKPQADEWAKPKQVLQALPETLPATLPDFVPAPQISVEDEIPF